MRSCRPVSNAQVAFATTPPLPSHRMLMSRLSLVASLAALLSCGSGASPTTNPPVVNGAAGVLCGTSTSEFNASAKVNATSTAAWSCVGTVRTLTGNGIPNHAVTSGNFVTPISSQSISVPMRLTPVQSGSNSGAIMNPGYALNSVKFDPGTDGSCAATATSTAPGAGCVPVMGRDPWRLEAIGGAFTFGTDESNAHVQPNGQYHYHGMPEAYLAKLNKGRAMTLVGFAVDGYPVYARYGYTSATDPASAVKIVTPSYRLKTAPDAGRPSVSIFPMGTFTQDYAYVAGTGDLDECNGRSGVTPEFPNGTYHYYITEAYPYIQRCVKGVTGTS